MNAQRRKSLVLSDFGNAAQPKTYQQAGKELSANKTRDIGKENTGKSVAERPCNSYRRVGKKALAVNQ